MMTENRIKMYLEGFKHKNENSICESCFKKTLRIVLALKTLDKE